jgi:hypothetical protein
MIFASIGSRLKEIENGEEKVKDSKISLSRYKGELFPPALDVHVRTSGDTLYHPGAFLRFEGD